MYEIIKVKNFNINSNKKTNDYIINLYINEKNIDLIIDSCYYHMFNEFILKIINGQQCSFVDKKTLLFTIIKNI